jgi:hypothetical protein
LPATGAVRAGGGASGTAVPEADPLAGGSDPEAVWLPPLDAPTAVALVAAVPELLPEVRAEVVEPGADAFPERPVEADGLVAVALPGGVPVDDAVVDDWSTGGGVRLAPAGTELAGAVAVTVVEGPVADVPDWATDAAGGTITGIRPMACRPARMTMTPAARVRPATPASTAPTCTARRSGRRVRLRAGLPTARTRSPQAANLALQPGRPPAVFT